MRMRLYKATGTVLSAVLKLLGVRLRATGVATLPERPVLFVVNHFTRFETFLVPYAVYRRFGRPVRSLATHVVFQGLFGRYLSALGVLSVRDPRRNRTIIGGLVTGRSDWVIYPEGRLVKSKQTRPGRRMGSPRARRARRPRTGAAMMALKSDLVRRRYAEACRRGDRPRMAHYERRYDLAGPRDVASGGTIVVPVSITYPRLRAGPNPIHRAARLLRRRLDPRVDEELQVEGTILFSAPTVSIHFGEPIEVEKFLDRPTELARSLVGWRREHHRNDLFLRRQARRLTGASMRRIYGNLEVNLDHLFCYGLRAARQDVLPVRRFRKALYLAAMDLRGRSSVRLDAHLRNGIIALAAGEDLDPVENIERLARDEGVLRKENGQYLINRAALRQHHDPQEIRLRKMVQVIANELEPVEAAIRAVRSAVNLDEHQLASRLPRAIYDGDRALFRREYARWRQPGPSRPAALGEPFFLEARRARGGVVLVHGYLACPAQMRPMAEHLHARGYSVYGVRLDGHGTAPANLEEVTWQGWLESIAQAHAVVGHRHPRTFVGGFSLGGVLACLFAAARPHQVDGLFTINAPLRLRSRRAALVPAVVTMNALLRTFHRSRPPARRENVSESPDLNYAVNYLRGTRELFEAVKACLRALPRVITPTLIVQADADPLVAPASAAKLFAGLAAPIKKIETLAADRHVIVRGDGSERVFEMVERFLEHRGQSPAREG